VIAVVWLREPFTRLRLLAILLSAAAMPLLRLASAARYPITVGVWEEKRKS
jgi:hypothetical protein